ncbi:MAG TPA: DUF1361 domain-containing protein [Oscillatoriaceae cyanobacterium M7585_C2015_266]|nr:DUF1361 domain-containing protein [Oscillatoriaceae cyanobacterium M7585_C2015_266]
MTVQIINQLINFNLIHTAEQALMVNWGWMAWNLFLALVPLVISFWLFHQPRARFLRWIVIVLTSLTFIIGINRYNLGHAINLARQVHQTYFGTGNIYIAGAFVLTLIFLGIDIWLFRQHGTRSLLWWFGFMVFIAFLPNAPYVLTDIIHLIEDIRQGYSIWIISLALIPQYLLFMLIGFQAYVLSLIYFGEYLKRQGWSQYILPVELILHALSSIGIYLGRFERFNSWHILTQPDQLVMSIFNDLTEKKPVLVMIVTFLIIAGLYWLMKQVTLGVIYYRQQTTLKQVMPEAMNAPVVNSEIKQP